MTATLSTSALTVTQRAIVDITNLLAAEEDSEDLALWVQVTGANGSDYAYDLAFDSVTTAAVGDELSDHDGLRVVIPADSIDKLQGATLDLPDDDAQGGLVLRNPNKPNPLDGVDLSTVGDLAERVALVIEHSVNPMLAQHGGFAQLAGVEGTKAFVLMGGGCHGCSISWLTLKSGITKTITEAVPEITEVVDVTDHAAGENPFFTESEGAASVVSDA